MNQIIDKRISVENLQVNQALYYFIEQEALPDTGITSALFWKNFSNIISDLSNENTELLAVRDLMQVKIDTWHKENFGDKFNFQTYKQFLTQIGYLAPQVGDFSITTENIDEELNSISMRV